jgi:hypothetical protein
MRRYWTESEVETLRELYPDMNSADVAKLMGVSLSRVYAKAIKLGIRKSDEFHRRMNVEKIAHVLKGGTSSRFKKGVAPWNKGLKGVTRGGTQTQFKPGHIPVNHKPIGYERVARDGYLERKVSDEGPPKKRFRAIHILVWEDANGRVPEGHVVSFKNGDKRDFRLENLELIHRREIMLRNTVHRYPEEIKAAMQAVGVLRRYINKRESSRHEK